MAEPFAQEGRTMQLSRHVTAMPMATVRAGNRRRRAGERAPRVGAKPRGVCGSQHPCYFRHSTFKPTSGSVRSGDSAAVTRSEEQPSS